MKLSMKDKFSIYLSHIYDRKKPTAIAAIHATVLSIFITVFSAYFFYINSEIRTKQLYAMSKAEEINNVQFSRYFYFPKGDEIIMAKGPEDIERIKIKKVSTMNF